MEWFLNNEGYAKHLPQVEQVYFATTFFSVLTAAGFLAFGSGSENVYFDIGTGVSTGTVLD
jgi:hypothetical protein